MMALFGRLTPWQALKQAAMEFVDDEMTTYAAALAYRFVFALFPFLIFLIALLGVLHLPQLFGWLREQMALVVPGEAMKQVNSVIDELETPRGGILSIGIALAIWSASAGVLGMIDALNVAYDVKERRPAWKRYALALGFTVGMGVVLAAAAGFMVLGPQAAGWLAQRLGVESVFVTVWSLLRWPLALLLLLLAVAVIYYALPNVHQRFRFITPGSVLSVIIWLLASIAFGYYVQNFADYSATYGSIGAIIILLFYFFLSSAVLLFGAEINAVIEAANDSQAAARRTRHEGGSPQQRQEMRTRHA